MTPARRGSFIRRAKDITISSTLALAILASGVIAPGCSSSEDDSAYSYEETTLSKGVRSYIKEVKPGEFEITNEESVPFDQAAAVVTYLNGSTITLTPDAAKAFIDKEIKDSADSTSTGTSHHHTYHRSGLSSMLLYGGMGYMLGRMGSNSYINDYRSRNPNSGAVYSNPGVYQKAQSVHSDVQASRSTRTVTSRPSGGRSGFFGRSASRSGG